MKCKSLKELWGGLFAKKHDSEEPTSQPTRELQMAPLSAGLRIDLTIPYGAGKEVAASQLIWVSPAESNLRPVKALKVLLIPN